MVYKVSDTATADELSTSMYAAATGTSNPPDPAMHDVGPSPTRPEKILRPRSQRVITAQDEFDGGITAEQRQQMQFGAAFDTCPPGQRGYEGHVFGFDRSDEDGEGPWRD